jgi:hypothetical protein
VNNSQTSSKFLSKILVCLLFIFVYILSAQSGLLGLLPVPQGFSLPSLGTLAFGKGTHGVPNIFALVADLIVYSLIIYSFVSVLFWLVQKCLDRRVLLKKR